MYIVYLHVPCTVPGTGDTSIKRHSFALRQREFHRELGKDELYHRPAVEAGQEHGQNLSESTPMCAMKVRQHLTEVSLGQS